MAIEIQELKANHERTMANHAIFKKRVKIMITLFYLFVVAHVLALLFYPGAPPGAASCDTIYCAISPWLVAGLVILIATFFGLVTKHLMRGTKAYIRAMRTLGSLLDPVK